MSTGHEWQSPRRLPFVLFTLASTLFMLVVFDRWGLDVFTFSWRLILAAALTLGAELLTLDLFKSRLHPASPVRKWFAGYGVSSAVGSVVALSVLGIVGLAQDRAPYVLVVVFGIRAAYTYVIAYAVDEIAAFAQETRRINSKLEPSLRLVEHVNSLLSQAEAAKSRHEIDVIAHEVWQPLRKLIKKVDSLSNEQVADEIETLIDDVLRPLSERMHPISVSAGLASAAQSLGVDFSLDEPARALDATNDLLDEPVRLELHRWLAHCSDLSIDHDQHLAVQAHTDNRVLITRVVSGSVAPLDARHAVAGLRPVDSRSISLPLRGQFVDQEMTGRELMGTSSDVGSAKRRHRYWSGDQGPKPALVAALALVALPVIFFIATAEVSISVLVTALITVLVPVVLALAIRRIRVSGYGWWPPTWIVLAWSTLGVLTGMAAAGTLVVFGNGDGPELWLMEITRGIVRISLIGMVVSFFGEFTIQARRTAHEVSQQTEQALRARDAILDREHQRARLIAEVLHRRVQARLSATAVLFRLGDRSRGDYELTAAALHTLPDLLAELSSKDPDRFAGLDAQAAASMPSEISISYQESVDLQRLMTRHPHAVRTLVEESATNAMRHGSARHLTVSARADGDAMVLVCADDGSGPPAEPSRPGLGSRIFDETVGESCWDLRRENQNTLAVFRILGVFNGATTDGTWDSLPGTTEGHRDFGGPQSYRTFN